MVPMLMLSACSTEPIHGTATPWWLLVVPVVIGLVWLLVRKPDPMLLTDDELLDRAANGAYRYDGMIGSPNDGNPQGYVVYDDGVRSVTMALGNAVDYANMFGGRVVVDRGRKTDEL